MLQWMGGSRRKVATSRKSTQKRQKQYFEQRKRQQQHQQTTGAEDILEQDKHNRSLDVISLLNLSAIGCKDKSQGPSARNELEDCTVTRGYQAVQSPSAMQASYVNPAEKFKGNSSCYEAATTFPNKTSVNALCRHGKAEKENHENDNGLQMAKEHQLSVIQLLGDDGPSSNDGETASHEPHVAFSIQGLGKVVTETPVHSPEMSPSALSCGLLSPSKAKRQAHLINNVSFESDNVEPDVDSMLWDIHLPSYESSMERRSCSRGTEEIFGNQNTRRSTCREFPLLTSSRGNLKQILDDELYYHVKRRNMDFWNASLSFQPNKVFGEEDYNFSSAKWDDRMEAGFADNLNIKNAGDHDFNLDSSYLHKKRTYINETGKCSIQETPRPYFQRQTPEDLHDFDFADETWKFMAGRSSGVRQVEKEPWWSDIASEEAGESVSLLSEESCSSTAVRVDATKRKSSKSLEKQKYGIDGMFEENKCSWRTSLNERNYDSRNAHRNEGYKSGWRSSKRELNLPNPTDNSYILTEQNVSPDIGGSFGAGYDVFEKFPDISGSFGAGYDVSENLGLKHLSQTSDTKRCTSHNCDLWSNDTRGGPPYMKFHANSRPIFKGPSDCPAKFSPCSTFISEKLDSGQPFTHMSSLESFLPNTMPGYCLPTLSQDSKIQREWNLINHSGSMGSAERFSGRDAGKTAVTLTVDGGKFESHVDVSGSNRLSTETEKSSNTSEFEKSIDCMTPKNNTPGKEIFSATTESEKSRACEAPMSRTPEKKTIGAKKNPEDVEDTSSSVEIPNLSNDAQGSINEEKCQHDTQVSFPCQSGNGVSGTQERSISYGGADPTCKLLIVQSCFRQLLHVQVLNETSVDGSIKKIPLERRTS